MKNKKVIIIGACVPGEGKMAKAISELKKEGFDPVMFEEEFPDRPIPMELREQDPFLIENIRFPEIVDIPEIKVKNKRERKFNNHY